MQDWFKKVSLIFISLVLSLVFASAISAKPTPTPSAVPSTQINSFEFFWPLASGKTQGESLYGLKRLKENMRGWLIFSPIKKADYLAFLATKRVLEAEKLAKDQKPELAKETLNQAARDIENSDKNLVKSISTGEQGGPARSSLAEKLNKLETFLKWYQETEVGLSVEIQNLLEKVMAEAGKL